MNEWLIFFTALAVVNLGIIGARIHTKKRRRQRDRDKREMRRSVDRYLAKLERDW